MIPAFANPVLKMNRQKDRRIEGVSNMGRSAIRHRGTTVVPKTTVVPIMGKTQMRQDFSAVVLPFSIGELSQTSECTKDAAKKWKAGRSLPSFHSMVMLARSNPVIRDWVLAHINVNPDFNSPQFLTMAASAMYQLAHQKDEAGDAMRQLIAQLAKGNGRK
jgi:hypothetical protein